MAETIVPVGDPRAVKRFSGALCSRRSEERLLDEQDDGAGIRSRKPVMVMNDLVNQAGEKHHL